MNAASTPTPQTGPNRRHGQNVPPVSGWIMPAGFSLLVLTILFLMALIVAAVLGHPIPCSGRGLVVFVIALTTGAAAGFLTGSATAEGNIPFFGGNVMKVAASGAIATIAIVLAMGFRLYAAASVCSDEGVLSDREKQISEKFWQTALARDWKTAYELFPPVLQAQMGFPEFVKASSYALSQFSEPPRRHDYERGDVVSGDLVVSILAEFDDVSTFRELLTFKRQNQTWVPWNFISNPVEWPQANSFRFVTLPAPSIVAAVGSVPEAERPKLVADRYAGMFVAPPGWSLVVDNVGAKVAARTCDVGAREPQSSTPVVLRHVLGGCGLSSGSAIQVVARIVSIDNEVTLDAVRFWR